MTCSKKTKKTLYDLLKVAGPSLVLGMASNQIHAQAAEDEAITEADILEEIVVTGIRGALSSALDQKRMSDNIKEIINAEDVGKLPDQNLAEVLENVTGIQIDRTAGVGTGVQIRGTNANRVEINGVSTTPSGASRTGINFEDIPAALIAGVEVTKVPDAKTIEGSVGGTVNLKTLRGLSLNEPLASIRVTGEHTDLTEATTPRVSGTFGNRFDTDAGPLGIVFSANYSRQDVASYDPRFDRDRVVLPTQTGLGSVEDFPFLRTQFLQQTINNIEFETSNFTTSFEFQPSDELKLFADVTYNSQERARQLAEVQFSGTGGNEPVSNTTNTVFETVDLGSIDTLDGPRDLGSVQVVAQGVIDVGGGPTGQINPANGPTGRFAQINPNLRTVTSTNSRVTDSLVFNFGGAWERDRLSISAEASHSASDTEFPDLRTTLDFINPNSPPPFARSADNGTPAEFSTLDGILQFGIAPGLATTPSTEQLLDPANYELRIARVTDEQIENSQSALRLDVEYDLSEQSSFFSSVGAGLRWNSNESTRNRGFVNASYTSRRFANARANGADFSDILVPGPSNFADADGRSLSVSDYLVINPRTSFDNPQAVIDTLTSALANAPAPAFGGPAPTISQPDFASNDFFDISEDTLALYVQGNYDFDIGNVPVRGNIGVRWITTSLDSAGINTANGVEQQTNTPGQDYDLFLPRWNFVVEPVENFLIRGGAARDIRRPDFDRLSTSVAFGAAAGGTVSRGNPGLQPETVTSYDLSAEYYFNQSSFVGIGIFYKKRDGIISNVTEFPIEPIGSDGQIERDITDPCEEGGIFNPIANRGVFSSEAGEGICVPFSRPVNNVGVSTQSGVEFTFQYDLSQFEDTLGWASGFGIIQNFTVQDSDPASLGERTLNGDANALTQLLGVPNGSIVEIDPLRNLSEYSYNTTLYYEKNRFSFRARYTWRSDFRTGENLSFNSLRIVSDRGQLNANMTYEVNDNLALQLEGVNLSSSDRPEYCLSDGGLLCDQGLTDRRIIFGARYRF